MLNLRQMDSIVHNTLLLFKGLEIKRREEGTNIFYDVHNSLESVQRFLGTYRVWEWHDGSGRSGWIPFDTNDSEVTRIRYMVWEAIMAIAVPANLSNNHETSTVQEGAAPSSSVEQIEADYSEDDVDFSAIGFDISAFFEIPLAWDVLVSASNSCLQGYAPGFVGYKIVKQLPASTTYRLWQSELGELGTVEFRKLGTGNSVIYVSGVPMNSLDTAPMWLRVKPEWDKRINEAWKGKRRIQEQGQEIEEYLVVSNRFDKAKARIKAKQKNHQADVIKAYFNRLVHDLTLWTSNQVIPPPYLITLAGLAEWPDMRNLSQEAQEYFEKYKLEIDRPDTQPVNIVKPEKALEDTTGWDSTLIEMWNEGHSRDEIANRVNVSKDRVTNRVTELRNKFGKNTVPYDKERKKRLIKS